MRYKIGFVLAGLLLMAGTLTGIGLAMRLPSTAAAEDSTVASETHADCQSEDAGAMIVAMSEVMDEETVQTMLDHMSEMHPGGQTMGETHEGMMGHSDEHHR